MRQRRSKKGKRLSSCTSAHTESQMLIYRASIFTKELKTDAAGGKSWKDGEA